MFLYVASVFGAAYSDLGVILVEARLRSPVNLDLVLFNLKIDQVLFVMLWVLDILLVSCLFLSKDHVERDRLVVRN